MEYNFNGKIKVANTFQYAAPSDAKTIINGIKDSEFKGNSKGVYILNLPLSFDIETTSFDTENGKRATMYVWQLGINGTIVIGRYWHEFTDVIDTMVKRLNLSSKKRVIIYVHNLAFEFQFIRKLFIWENVFSIEERRPIYALTSGGVEFRCSYLLSGYDLATVAKNLTKYKIAKLVGNLDYDLIRHNQTPLTPKEIEYCVNDVKIVMLYIKEYLERVKNIHSIPITKTGAVRKFCRKNCFTKQHNGKSITNLTYKNKIQSLQIADLNEFAALQRAFCGGFTHANANYVMQTLNNVASYDFTSSYPAVMVSEKFPCSRGVRIDVTTQEQFYNLIEHYACVFDIEFNDIMAITDYENYISTSKCFVREQIVENNGRIVAAKCIALTITEIDFKIIRKMYNYDFFRVGYLYAYKREYLPKEFIKSVLDLYAQKTELKGVKGKESEYLNAKEMLNSTYGMCVTSPLRDTIEYVENQWNTHKLNENEKEKALTDYNLSQTRFLYYIWGVFITAHARKNLFTAIYNLKDDYIYSDTDSVKFLNNEKHTEYFTAYNALIAKKLQVACNYHGISFDLCTPKTITGKTKLLGAWDFEGIYDQFKTLGAKRYLTEKQGEFTLTISGVDKHKAMPYLLQKYGKNGVFAAFNNYLHIPSEYSGKTLLTYIDFETFGEITDYLGKTAEWHELSSVNLSQSDFTLSLTGQFIRYLHGLREFKRN